MDQVSTPKIEQIVNRPKAPERPDFLNAEDRLDFSIRWLSHCLAALQEADEHLTAVNSATPQYLSSLGAVSTHLRFSRESAERLFETIKRDLNGGA